MSKLDAEGNLQWSIHCPKLMFYFFFLQSIKKSSRIYRNYQLKNNMTILEKVLIINYFFFSEFNKDFTRILENFHCIVHNFCISDNCLRNKTTK